MFTIGAYECIDYLKKLQEKVVFEIDIQGKIINQKEFEFTQLNRQIEIYKKTYDNLSVRIEEVRIAKAAQLGEVKLVSSALEPKYPIKPNKKLYVMISAIIGLTVGIFLAFF